MAATDISVQRLRELLDYDPSTGLFTWRVTHHPKCKAGAIAGTKGTAKYVVVCIDRVLHYAHRLAFLHVMGRPAVGDVDHVDGDTRNNRWANLREGTRGQNMQNRRPISNNATGFLGVCKYRGRFAAQITVNGVHQNLGVFDTAEEAHEAYIKSKRSLHEFNTL
jgi:hypothetical protein